MVRGNQALKLRAANKREREVPSKNSLRLKGQAPACNKDRVTKAIHRHTSYDRLAQNLNLKEDTCSNVSLLNSTGNNEERAWHT